MDELEKEIKDVIKPLSGNVSVYVKYLLRNEVLEINGRKQMDAASVIKLSILCEFYKQVKKNTIDTNEWIQVNESNIVDGSGVIKLLHHHTKYTVYDLAKLMIVVSDNSATNEIVDMMGWETVEKYMKELSLPDITFRHKMMITAGRGDNLITANNIGILLEKIYTNSVIGSDEMLAILKGQRLRNYLPKLLPKDVPIANKTGSLEDTLHDVGIVFSDNPFVFVFLSEGQTSREETGEVLSQCAKLCFARH